MMEQLRFAPIIRVSTEKQADDKQESLRTQTTQITNYVHALGGVIPDECWKYRGQEHATPENERQLLEQLLTDCSRDIFDAVIVCDPSRWSRDNRKSKEGLETLRVNGIRFYAGMMEYDLFQPNHMLMLGMATEINEWQAREQGRKSIESRIHKARRGCHATGKLPWGRVFDKNTELWDVDLVKKRIINEIAHRYIDGERLRDLAKQYGIDRSTLYATLMKNCGTEYIQHFHKDDLNINVDVPTVIPRLLEDDMILKVRQRAKINGTTKRGDRDKYHNYLLGGYVFCHNCGSTITGGTSGAQNRYVYRHRSENYKECKFHGGFRAAELEDAVLMELVHTLGDPELIERAIERANPAMNKRAELEKDHAHWTGELTKVKDAVERLVRNVVDGLLSDEDVRNQRDKLQEREREIGKHLFALNSQLSNCPDPKQVRKYSHWGGKVISAVYHQNPELVLKRDYAWKRRLIERAFNGVDAAGNRLGVYLEITPEGERRFQVRGLLNSTVRAFPQKGVQNLPGKHSSSRPFKQTRSP